MCLIESIYIFNNRNLCILQHPASSITALSGSDLITSYLSVPSPRPPVLLLPNRPVPTVAYTVTRDELLVITPVTREAEPLEVLELLHRILDIFEDFVGTPLLQWKIQESYDLLGQVLNEVLDGGLVAVSESNALQDLIVRPGWMEKLLSGGGLPRSIPSMGNSALPSAMANLSLKASDGNEMPTPWRKSNVRHTTNKMTIDMVESVDAIYAPSGRPLTARANGTIAFTCEVSGVPDVLLTLTSSPSSSSIYAKQSHVSKVMQYPVFHPCVRLSRWRDRAGEISFIPPDGRFVLAGYESDLLGGTDYLSRAVGNLQYDSGLRLPVRVTLNRAPERGGGGGGAGDDYSKWGMEVNLVLDPDFVSSSSTGSNPAFLSTGSSGTGSSGRPGIGNGGGAAASLTAALSNIGSNLPSSSLPPSSSSHNQASSSSSLRPTIDHITISVPAPGGVQRFGDIRASAGEAFYSFSDDRLVWKISGKVAMGLMGNRRSSDPFVAATVRCVIVRDETVEERGSEDDDDDDDEDHGEEIKGGDKLGGDYGASADEDDVVVQRNPWEYTDDLLESSPGPSGASSSAPSRSKQRNKRTNRGDQQGRKDSGGHETGEQSKDRERERDREIPPTAYFPTSASVQFQITGWLASGLRVQDLVLDQRRSKGLGNNVMPYKRVKYVTTAAGDGIEIRKSWDVKA